MGIYFPGRLMYFYFLFFILKGTPVTPLLLFSARIGSSQRFIPSSEHMDQIEKTGFQLQDGKQACCTSFVLNPRYFFTLALSILIISCVSAVKITQLWSESSCVITSKSYFPVFPSLGLVRRSTSCLKSYFSTLWSLFNG